MRKVLSNVHTINQRLYRTQQKLQKGIVSPRLTVPKQILYPEYALDSIPAEAPEKYYCYNEYEIPKLRQSARLARKILEFALSLAKPGITTDEIDRITHQEILKYGAYPSPLNYYGFPKSICTSVNEVVCHGIPDSRVLQEGDLIKIDVSLYLDGFHGDNCGAVVVGDKPDPKLINLIQVTKEAVNKAIAVCEAGVSTCEIGKTIEAYAKQNNFNVVHEFCGHGTGILLHMKPLILHYHNTEEIIMKPGMCFTIEPILVEGSNEIYTWPDNWTASTKDGSWSAQIEHQILIQPTGPPEILTLFE